MLSRPAFKGLAINNQKRIQNGLNMYFSREWGKYDLELIYSKLGNDINNDLCIRFSESDFNLDVLDGG